MRRCEGATGSGDQQSILATLALAGGAGITAALTVTIYRTRGLLAAWTATAVSSLLIAAMAARSLDDPELVNRGNLVFAIATIPLVLGVWGLIKVRTVRTVPVVPNG